MGKKIILRIEEVFSFDLRSLALFRIGLGLILILDLIVRSSAINAFYTDSGVLPRAIVIEKINYPWSISIHLANGTTAVQAVLFLVAGMFALLLLVGYRTRLVTIISWFLLISLQTRNPLVLQGGDVLLRMLLFWSIFLPLGARYSLDSMTSSNLLTLPKRIFTMGTIAYFMQIVFVYWFSVMHKTAPEWRVEGSAVYYALSTNHFTTPFGYFMLQFPAFLTFLTYATFWFELIGPFLLLIPIFFGPIRFFVVLAFIALHIGFRSGLELGPFPWVASLAMFVFLPSWFWDRFLSKFQSRSSKGVRIYYDSECGFCKRAALFIQIFFLIPHAQVLSTQDDSSIYEDMQKHNSWVIVDATGQRYFKFQAVVYLFRMSPLLWPIAAVLKWKPSVILGNVWYEFLSNRRLRVCRIDKHKEQQRPINLGGSLGASMLILFFMIYVFLWNLDTLKNFSYRTPKEISWIGELLRIDQKWDMFAPHPSNYNGWYIIVGELSDGTQIDLFRDGAKVVWEKPKLVSSLYKNERWRKYMTNLTIPYKVYRRLYFAQYLCRDWNSHHNSSERLERLTIYFMEEQNLRDDPISKPEKVKYLDYDCFNP